MLEKYRVLIEPLLKIIGSFLKKYRVPIELFLASLLVVVSIFSCSQADKSVKVSNNALELTRAHNFVMTRPIVYFKIIHVPIDKEISFNMVNAGTGGALIHNFELYVDGNPILPFPSDPRKAIDALGLSGINFTESDVAKSLVLTPGQVLKIIDLPVSEYSDEAYERFKKEISRLSVISCYCSMYEETCFFSRDGYPVQNQKSCMVNGVDDSFSWKRGELKRKKDTDPR
ncbi:MAG: hypothetical protein PHF20_00765 [Halothiobacillaceae bacterium]|nr:hypothetical protein [Halothiobacillaceae bacterium]